MKKWDKSQWFLATAVAFYAVATAANVTAHVRLARARDGLLKLQQERIELLERKR